MYTGNKTITIYTCKDDIHDKHMLISNNERIMIGENVYIMKNSAAFIEKMLEILRDKQ